MSQSREQHVAALFKARDRVLSHAQCQCHIMLGLLRCPAQIFEACKLDRPCLDFLSALCRQRFDHIFKLFHHVSFSLRFWSNIHADARQNDSRPALSVAGRTVADWRRICRLQLAVQPADVGRMQTQSAILLLAKKNAALSYLRVAKPLTYRPWTAREQVRITQAILHGRAIHLATPNPWQGTLCESHRGAGQSISSHNDGFKYIWSLMHIRHDLIPRRETMQCAFPENNTGRNRGLCSSEDRRPFIRR